MQNEPADIARKKLLEIERANAARIVAEFQKIKTRLLENTLSVRDAIETARSGGAGNVENLLAEQNRLADLFGQVSAAINNKTGELSQLTTGGQRAAVSVAKTQAAATPELLANLNFFDGGAVSEIVGLAGNKRKVDFLFQRIAPAVRAEMFSALSFGIASGASNYQIARELKNKFDFAPVRALTIARTETNRSYREANRLFYADTPGVVGWVWLAALDLRTCPVCWSKHGQVFRTNKRFNSHPNCLVENTKVSLPDAVAATKRRYVGKVIEIITSNGHRLTVTPNHPIMTSKGWIAANLLTKRDYVISTFDSQRVLSAVNPNHYNKPTVANEIFQSISKALPVSSVTMPTTAENFHSDAGNRQSDVNIVFSDSFLRDGFDVSALDNPIIEQNFISRSDVLPQLSRFSSFYKFGFGSRPAFDLFMQSGNVPGVFGFCPFGHHQTVSGGDVSDSNAIFGQNTADNISANIQSLGNGVFALSGGITTKDGFDIDRIVSLRHKVYDGNVYNFETSTGYYIADNILTHNCRCTMKAVFADSPPEQTGIAKFAGLSDAQKTAILGKRRFELYRAGMPFKSFIGEYNTPFGKTPRIINISNLPPISKEKPAADVIE